MAFALGAAVSWFPVVLLGVQLWQVSSLVPVSLCHRCSLASVAFRVCAGHTPAGLSSGAAASWLPVVFLGFSFGLCLRWLPVSWDLCWRQAICHVHGGFCTGCRCFLVSGGPPWGPALASVFVGSRVSVSPLFPNLRCLPRLCRPHPRWPLTWRCCILVFLGFSFGLCLRCLPGPLGVYSSKSWLGPACVPAPNQVWACSKAVLLLLSPPRPDFPPFSLFGRYPGLGSLAWLAELELDDLGCPPWDQHPHLPRPWWLLHWVPLFPGFRWSSLGSSSGKCLRWFPCLCVTAVPWPPLLSLGSARADSALHVSRRGGFRVLGLGPNLWPSSV